MADLAASHWDLVSLSVTAATRFFLTLKLGTLALSGRRGLPRRIGDRNQTWILRLLQHRTIQAMPWGPVQARVPEHDGIKLRCDSTTRRPPAARLFYPLTRQISVDNPALQLRQEGLMGGAANDTAEDTVDRYLHYALSATVQRNMTPTVLSFDATPTAVCHPHRRTVDFWFSDSLVHCSPPTGPVAIPGFVAIWRAGRVVTSPPLCLTVSVHSLFL